jgi:alpha/beta superfamily hydrolase
MNKTDPTFSFSIHSVHDGCKLHCRLYLPGWVKNIESTPASAVRGAILAHPYTALGGTYDDEVIGFLTDELLHEGYIVGTFNFRSMSLSKPWLEDG